MSVAHGTHWNQLLLAGGQLMLFSVVPSFVGCAAGARRVAWPCSAWIVLLHARGYFLLEQAAGIATTVLQRRSVCFSVVFVMFLGSCMCVHEFWGGASVLILELDATSSWFGGFRDVVWRAYPDWLAPGALLGLPSCSGYAATPASSIFVPAKELAQTISMPCEACLFKVTTITICCMESLVYHQFY